MEDDWIQEYIPSVLMANMDCNIVITKFKLQSR